MTRKTFTKWFLIALLFVAIIIGSFAILDHYMFLNSGSRWLDGGAWVSIIIGAISSSATLFLGYVSYWQNKKQRQDNLASERRIRDQYQAEKEEAINQHRIDVLVDNMNAYIKVLHEIDLKLVEKDFACDLLDFKYTIEKISMSKSVSLESRQSIIAFKRTIGETIVLLNYIYNSIVYKKYYVPKLYNCAISIVKLRHKSESYAANYLSSLLEYTEKIEDSFEIKKFKDATIELMDAICKFSSCWTLYLQEALTKYERMTYKNNIYEFFEWFDESNVNVGKLRKDVAQLEEDFQKKDS
ncbi:MAG: hypothetical protein J6L90_00665 [Clostridia bacterium]|nr:hypothetical protein [Clostridia bacterium]